MLAYQNEVGRVISMTTGFNWNGASTRQATLVKPSGAKVVKSTSKIIVDDSGTGQVHFESELGDLDEVGDYLIQFRATFASGEVLYSPLRSLTVEDVL